MKYKVGDTVVFLGVKAKIVEIGAEGIPGLCKLVGDSQFPEEYSYPASDTAIAFVSQFEG